MYWLVMYDIAAPKRLYRTAKLCENAGLQRLQKSVFLGELAPEAMDRLAKELRGKIRAKEDSVMIFPMGKRHLQTARTLGRAGALAELLERKDVVFL